MTSSSAQSPNRRRCQRRLQRYETPMMEDSKTTTVDKIPESNGNNNAVRRGAIVDKEQAKKAVEKRRSIREHKKEQRKAICRLAEKKHKRDRVRATNGSYDEASEASKLGHLPCFSLDEIRWGHKLGNGAFGSVFEVKNIVLEDRSKSSSSSSDTNDIQTAARSFMAKHCIREVSCQAIAASDGGDNDDDTKEKKPNTSTSRYAIKKLRCKITHGDQKMFAHAMIDMANETRLLASIPHHPNIIKLRGMAMCMGDDSESKNESANAFPSYCFHEHYGLVLDRLYGTLEDRIDDWVEELGPQRSGNCRGGMKRFDSFSKNLQRRFREEELLDERLRACHDVASGLAHLHKHKIIHRDIKPPNIGFNIRGDLTLFDFGLSRELPETNDPLFKMTGFVGSPRYMAPEVGLKRKYNAKCDVYSFGCLAWYILTLQKPFDGCDINQLKTVIWPGDQGITGPGDWNKNSSRNNRNFSKIKRSLFDSLKSSSKIPSYSNSNSNSTITRTAHLELEEMIDRAFCRDIAARPTMKELKEYLRNECQEHSSRCKLNNSSEDEFGEYSEELNPESRFLSCRRRSTYVFEFDDVLGKISGHEKQKRQSCFRRSLEDNTHHGADLAQSSLNTGNCSDAESSDSSEELDDAREDGIRASQ